MPPVRIMIVDDYAAFRQVVKTVLQPLGAEFLDCEDGQQAAAQYPQFRPDFVLMDLAMKGQDGLITTAQIKAKYPEATIFILTQFDDAELRAAAKAAGARAYLLKDDLSELLALLRASGSPES